MKHSYNNFLHCSVNSGWLFLKGGVEKQTWWWRVDFSLKFKVFERLFHLAKTLSVMRTQQSEPHFLLHCLTTFNVLLNILWALEFLSVLLSNIFPNWFIVRQIFYVKHMVYRTSERIITLSIKSYNFMWEQSKLGVSMELLRVVEESRHRGQRLYIVFNENMSQ